MSISVPIPSLGDSVTEARLVRWMKEDGDTVAVDEPLCELETDKANVDLPSPGAGQLRITKQAGATVTVGELVAEIDAAGAGAGTKADAPKADAPKAEAKDSKEPKEAKAAPAETHAAAAPTFTSTLPTFAPAPATSAAAPTPAPQAAKAMVNIPGTRREPMTKIRQIIAQRLVSAQREAAMLTTFNEADMTEVQRLRKKHAESFEKEHGVKLGMMAFFARAVTTALKEFPNVNAMIDGTDVIYYDNVHLGIAVSTERGLVVPVLRNADDMSFSKIETEIKRVALAARNGKLGLQELSGGTFSITNGGVFGSMMSTPILNAPQSAILGMHAIVNRPMAVGDKIEIRPMMYLALSYDHRLIDGKDSVSFLVRVKQLLEDPARLVFDI